MRAEIAYVLLIYELFDNHEILHAKTEDQDLCRIFFRNWFKLLEAEICQFIMLQLTWNTLYKKQKWSILSIFEAENCNYDV